MKKMSEKQVNELIKITTIVIGSISIVVIVFTIIGIMVRFLGAL